MLANMASSLIMHKRIKTTTAKAKALRSFVEPVITRSREDSTHSRRMAFKHLRDKEAVSELFRDVAGKIGDRPGGYTRIIKLGNRLGDNADMCIIELVDYNENLLAEKAAAKTKTARRRRGGKKKAEQPEEVQAAETITDVEEEVETAKADVADSTDEAGDVTETSDAETQVDTAAGEVKPEPEAKSQAEETREEAKDQETEPEVKSQAEELTGETEEDTKEEDDEEKKEK